jgi:hypothetical protein
MIAPSVSGPFQFVMIDTVILAGNSDLPGGRKLTGNTLPGPEDSKLADDQWQWVRCVQCQFSLNRFPACIVAVRCPDPNDFGSVQGGLLGGCRPLPRVERV